MMRSAFSAWFFALLTPICSTISSVSRIPAVSIILRDIPSNEIFRILATLFIIGLPIWTMSKSFDNNDLIDKINRKLPIFFGIFYIKSMIYMYNLLDNNQKHYHIWYN